MHSSTKEMKSEPADAADFLKYLSLQNFFSFFFAFLISRTLFVRLILYIMFLENTSNCNKKSAELFEKLH